MNPIGSSVNRGRGNLGRPAISSLFIHSVAVIVIAFSLTSQSAVPPAEPEPVWRKIDQSQYVGAIKCAECHQGYFDTWKESLHAKMIQPAIATGTNRTILADFTVPSEHRQFELKDVKWVIGSRWKQRYVGEVDGEEVVFPAQWSVAKKIWQSYRGKGDWWYPHHPDWKTRSNFKLCAGCHSTGVDAVAGNWVELNIACESCHGPGKAHSANATKANIVNPARLSVERSMDVCLSCHLSGKPPGTKYAWPVGYQPGLALSDFWHGFKAEKGKKTAEFLENGTANKNRVQGNTFLRSVMAHAGLQCTVCHDGHGSRHQSMTIKSGPSNALCLSCHGPRTSNGPKYATLSDHTHHAPESTGSQCIECHMAKTGKNSVAAEARNHTFEFISPAATKSLGVPNSCNICHSDKTTEWALGYVKKWYP